MEFHKKVHWGKELSETLSYPSVKQISHNNMLLILFPFYNPEPVVFHHCWEEFWYVYSAWEVPPWLIKFKLHQNK